MPAFQIFSLPPGEDPEDRAGPLQRPGPHSHQRALAPLGGPLWLCRAELQEPQAPPWSGLGQVWQVIPWFCFWFSQVTFPTVCTLSLSTHLGPRL